MTTSEISIPKSHKIFAFTKGFEDKIESQITILAKDKTECMKKFLEYYSDTIDHFILFTIKYTWELEIAKKAEINVNVNSRKKYASENPEELFNLMRFIDNGDDTLTITEINVADIIL